MTLQLLWDDKGRQIASVGPELPSRGDLKEIAERKLPIFVGALPLDHKSLDFLQEIYAEVTDLRVFAAGYRNFFELSLMPHLRRLRLDEEYVLSSTDLSGLRDLESYDGPIFENIAKLASLSDVRLHVGELPDMSGWHFSPTQLELVGRARTARVPAIGDATKLKSLTLGGVRHFDLNGIAAYSEIQSIHLVDIRSLINVRELLALPALRELKLSNVREIDDFDMVRDSSLSFDVFRSLSKAQRDELVYTGRAHIVN